MRCYGDGFIQKYDHVDLLQIDKDALGILRVMLNDPARRNALSEAMMAGLPILADAAIDASIRVIILAANGPAFCAGHDLKEMRAGRANADAGRARFAQLLQRCSAVMRSIMANPKPVIAAVDGLATAAGCQLVASCDLAYAGPRRNLARPVFISVFSVQHRWSRCPAMLGRNMRWKCCLQAMWCQRRTQLKSGLFNAVVDAQPLADHVTDVAHKIASKSPATLATGKNAFYQQREMAVADAYDYAVGVMVENMLHCDAVEGINAFIDKAPTGKTMAKLSDDSV